MAEDEYPGELQIAIARRNSAFVTALMKGDSHAASRVYAEDATILPPAAAPMHGRPAIRAFWQAGLDAGMAEIELATTRLRARQDIACEIGRYTMRIRAADGSDVVDEGNYVLIHERAPDGGWQRALEMFSPGATAGATGLQPRRGIVART